MKNIINGFLIAALLISCDERNSQPEEPAQVAYSSTLNAPEAVPELAPVEKWPDSNDLETTLYYDIKTGNTKPEEVVIFANSLMGTRYQYGSIDPHVGFDCSGFITYVFNHFKIKVPRSSIDFTDVGKPVSVAEAKPGDIILFTGTNPNIRKVGHMGIVNKTLSGDDIEFIHSSSGKAYGVTLSSLSSHYRDRFVKVIRIFPQNDRN